MPYITGGRASASGCRLSAATNTTSSGMANAHVKAATELVNYAQARVDAAHKAVDLAVSYFGALVSPRATAQ